MKPALAALSLILAAACMPAPPQSPPPIETLPGDACDAAAYQHLIGQPRDAVEAEEYTGPVRIVPHDGFVTLDHNPLRINFELEKSGKVERITCG